MRKISTVAVVSLLLLILPIKILAHHSNAEYDWDQLTELEATVTRVFWQNPHIRLTVKTVTAEGGEDTWDLHARDVASLARRGINGTEIQEGDVINLAGHASTQRKGKMFVTNILLPNGLELILRGNVQPHFSDQYLGDGGWVVSSVNEDDEPEGIFRVWSTVLERNLPEFPEGLPLTGPAREALSQYDSNDDDLSLSCIPLGMPGAMTRGSGAPHPFEFVQFGEDFQIKFEFYDSVRTIHMSEALGSVRETPSPMGYSVGRWEGDTLVVETSGVNYPFNDVLHPTNSGIPQSGNARFVERFTLSEDEHELVYDVIATDPVNLTQPISIERRYVWGWVPGIRVEPFECAIDGFE